MPSRQEWPFGVVATNSTDSYTLIVVPLPAEAETCIMRAALGAGDGMSLCVRNCFGEARRFTNWAEGA